MWLVATPLRSSISQSARISVLLLAAIDYKSNASIGAAFLIFFIPSDFGGSGRGHLSLLRYPPILGRCHGTSTALAHHG